MVPRLPAALSTPELSPASPQPKALCPQPPLPQGRFASPVFPTSQGNREGNGPEDDWSSKMEPKNGILMSPVGPHCFFRKELFHVHHFQDFSRGLAPPVAILCPISKMLPFQSCKSKLVKWRMNGEHQRERSRRQTTQREVYSKDTPQFSHCLHTHDIISLKKKNQSHDLSIRNCIFPLMQCYSKTQSCKIPSFCFLNSTKSKKVDRYKVNARFYLVYEHTIC